MESKLIILPGVGPDVSPFVCELQSGNAKDSPLPIKGHICYLGNSNVINKLELFTILRYNMRNFISNEKKNTLTNMRDGHYAY